MELMDFAATFNLDYHSWWGFCQVLQVGREIRWEQLPIEQTSSTEESLL